MGSTWKFDIGVSSSKQKTAFVWNSAAIRVKKSGDIEIPYIFFDSDKNKDRKIFVRSPQLLNIVFLDADGREKNDILLIGLHLAAGHKWKEPRQEGMEILVSKVPEYLSSNEFDTNEKDIIFLGDLNDATFLDLYDDKADEQQLNHLFPFMVSEGFIALSGPNYPATRVNGRQIDHIIISPDFNPECIEDEAKVLVPSIDFNEYRIKFSDHFPVLINVKLHNDDD